MSATDDVIARLAEARDKLVAARKLGFDGVAATGDLERHIEDAIGQTTGGDFFLGVIAEKKAAASKSVDGITTLISDIDATIARLHQAGNRPGAGRSHTTGGASAERETAEYERRVGELAKDPAHGGTRTRKTLREADVALELEKRGVLPATVVRAELDTSDASKHRDQGDFVDGAGQRWDVKSPADIFPYGRNAGQEMPAGQKGRYDGAELMVVIDRSISEGEYVIIDTKNLTAQSRADVVQRVASRPDLNGKVIIFND